MSPHMAGSHVSSHSHIKEDPFPLFLNAEGLSLFVNVADHHLCHLCGIFFHRPHAAVQLFDFSEQEVGQDLAPCGWKGPAEYNIEATGHTVVAD